MIPYYQQSQEELFSNLVCDAAGLTQVEVEQRLKRYGPNRLREAPPPPMALGYVLRTQENPR